MVVAVMMGRCNGNSNGCIRIYVTGDPQAQPRPRFRVVYSKVKQRMVAMAYNPADNRTWREILMWELKSQYMKNRGIVKKDAGVSVELVFYFRRPKSHYNSRGMLKENAPVHKTTRPDMDNIEKPVLDILKNTGYYNDDCQIYEIKSRKMYVNEEHPEPGVEITIRYSIR